MTRLQRHRSCRGPRPICGSPLADAAGQDHRGPPELRLPRRPARPPPRGPRPTSSSRRARSRPPAARSSARPAPSCSPSRARSRCHRHPRPPRRARRTPGTTSAWVTAANDFGLYDLRANDKGSNVRSKGGDGFTPIGPDADRRPRGRSRRAAACAPGSTASSCRTTPPPGCSSRSPSWSPTSPSTSPSSPATSSSPAPRPARRWSCPATSSRSRSTLRRRRALRPRVGWSPPSTQGDRAFDPALGSLPAVDDTQRAEAWGSREAAGLPPAGHDTGTLGPVDLSCARSSRRVPVAALSQPAAQARPEQRDDRRRRGRCTRARSSSAPPGRCASSPTAKTCSPPRRRLQRAEARRSTPSARARSSSSRPAARPARARSATSSPCARRRAERPASSPTAACATTTRSPRSASRSSRNGAHPAVLGRRHVPWDLDVTIACGGTTVQPGDVIVGDGDGVIVIPPALAEEVVDAALAQEDEDAWIAEQVAAGHPVDGLFPMNAEWRARYDAWRDEHGSTIDGIGAATSEQVAAGLPLDQGPHRAPGVHARLPAGARLDRRGARHERRAGARGDPPARGRGTRHLRAQRRRPGGDGRRARSTATACRRSASSRAPRPRWPRAALDRRRPATGPAAINERMIETARPLRPARVHRAQPASSTRCCSRQCANPRCSTWCSASGRGSATCATRRSASCPAARSDRCASTSTSCDLIETGAPLARDRDGRPAPPLGDARRLPDPRTPRRSLRPPRPLTRPRRHRRTHDRHRHRDRRTAPRPRRPARPASSTTSTAQFVDSVDGDTFDVLDPVTNETYLQAAAGKKADIDLAVAAARRAFTDGPVAADAAARALAHPAPHRRHRRVPRRPARRARVLRLRPADHPGARPGAPGGRELPLLRRPDRRAGRRHLQGARPPDQLRQPQADRRRRADHAVEHPVHARVVEARPGAGHRQHRRAQAGRVHAAVGVAVGGHLRGGRAARRACSTSSTGSARMPATRW